MASNLDTMTDFDAVIVEAEMGPPAEAPRGSIIAQVIAYRRDEFILGTSKWSHSLLGCFRDGSILCEEVLCPYCHIGYLYEYLETGEQRMNWTVCAGSFCADFFFAAFGLARCTMVSTIRQRLLRRYDIAESALATCCISCFCGSCAMCQMHREMNHRWETPGRLCSRAPLLSARMGLPFGDSSRSDESGSSRTLSSEFSSTLEVRAAGIQPPLPRYGYDNENSTGYPAHAVHLGDEGLAVGATSP